MLSNMWVRRWRLELTPDDFGGCRSFTEMVCRLHGAWARSEGKPRWGDKTPHYLGAIPTLLELFPRAKILHVYRDGRDVALSWLRRKMEPRNTYMAACYWRDRVRAGMRVGRQLPPGSYMEVRYEELLRDTEGVMRRVCDFIGEPFCEEVLKPNRLNLGPLGWRRKRPEDGGRSKSTVVTDNAGGWRTRMKRRQRILFESVAGDLLSELGYEVRGPRRRVTLPERGFWRIHHAVLYVSARLASPKFASRLKSYVLLRVAPGVNGRRAADSLARR